MDCREMLINGYEDIQGAMERILGGLTNEELKWQPKSDGNSIGWLAWHITRLEDSQIAYLTGGEQLWTEEGWHTRFNRPADAKDIGFGHTPKQVTEFNYPDTGIFLDYSRAVFERIKHYFLSISETDLDQPLDEYWNQVPVKVGWRLISVLEDCWEHIGQMGYVRGLRQGKGWQKY